MIGWSTVILVLLGFAFYKGYKKGIINRIAAILGLFLAYNFTGLLFGYLHQYLIEEGMLNPETSKYITYALTFVLIIVMVRLLAAAIVKLLKWMGINFVNKFAGGLTNVALWGLFLSIVIYFLTDLNILGEKAQASDAVVPYMKTIGEFMMQRFFS